MAKVLILANFKLSFELAEGANASDQQVRAKGRKILRLLKKLAEEEPNAKGTVESLEFEGFVYDRSELGNPDGYVYDKYEHESKAEPGQQP